MLNYTDLPVWQKAASLTLEIYGATASFPKDQIAGITLKIRRLCSQVAASIAEGCSRQEEEEFPGFILISMSYTRDLEEQLRNARDLGYLISKEYNRLAGELSEIQQMLGSLVEELKRDLRAASDE